MRQLAGRIFALQLGLVAAVLLVAAILHEAPVGSAWLPIGAAGFGLAVLATLVAARFLHGPLGSVREALDRMARGEPARRLPWRSRDALGDVARSVDHLSEQHRAALAQEIGGSERLQAMLQSMVEGVLVLDAEGRVVLANPRLRELFDAWGDVVGRRPLELIRRDDLATALEEAAASHGPVTREFALGGDDERFLQMHAVRFPGEGPALGTVAVFHDQTELRRLERVRREFVANVSHELKTPLTAIRGFAETLLHERLDDEQRTQYTEVIVRHAGRLSALIDDLLELSRIEGRREPLRLVEVAIGDVARALMRDLKPRIDAKGLEARVEAEGDLLALADRRAVEQILLNLLDNAIKYSEPGDRLVVEVARASGRVQVAVRDTGMGIPDGDLARIFERFYRVDKARTRDLGGTGLGLAIVKHLVQAMDGDVDAESEEGAGTVFRFTLPGFDPASDNVTPS